MRDIWIISDTHFGHENIIHYTGRPFSNAWEMNQAILENWNSVVKVTDIVYHLGDVYMGMPGQDAWHLLKKLQGHKRLILGNHDNGEDKVILGNFEKIRAWRHF